MGLNMIKVDNKTMTDGVNTYDVPADTASIAIQPKGGSIDLLSEDSGSDGFTIADKEKYIIDSRDISGSTLRFQSAAGVIVQFCRLTGTLS